VAVVSLLIASRCSAIAAPGSAEYVGVVLLLALMVGAAQLLLGLLRAGFLVNLLSHAVIRGYTAAAAIIIGLSQLKHLLGVPLTDQHAVHRLIAEVVSRAGEVSWPTAAVGAAGLLALTLGRRASKRFPTAIVLVALSIAATWLLGLDRLGVAVVGRIPQGVPPLSMPPLAWGRAAELAPAAMTIVFVAFIESIAIAKWVAARERYDVDANQEFRALGLANVAAAFVSGYPVTGGFSRTAVNYQAGARTPLASIITAALVGLTLAFLTPLLYFLPKAVLAAVVIVAVSGLVDPREAVRLFRLKPTDGGSLVLTFLATLALGVETGVLIGVACSLALFIWRSAHPHAAEVGYLPAEDAFRNVKRFPDARTYPNVLILRIDASLYFANLRFVEDWLRTQAAKRDALEYVVLDLGGVNDMDAVAVTTLEQLMEDYSHRGVRFALAGMKGPVRDLVGRAGWESKYGHWTQFTTVRHALEEIGVSPL
jgi:SulP family sulfate permease